MFVQHVRNHHETAEADRGYESSPETPTHSAKEDSAFHHHRHCHGNMKANHPGNLHVDSPGGSGAKNCHQCHSPDGDGDNKDGGRKIVGLLAQEVRDVLPDAVFETVSYRNSTFILKKFVL